MKFTCVIIDDEEAARKGLESIVSEMHDLELIGTCANGVEAIDRILADRPDLIFLDVQMPGINGFEVLASLPRPWPAVIFITAHDQFALRAFEVNAVDYLLKPFSDERIAEAVNRAKQSISNKKGNSLHNLVSQTRASLRGPSSVVETGSSGGRLVIKADGSIHLLDTEDLIYVEAFDYYVKIHVRDRFFLLRETMKKMEQRLPETVFVRIHKSFIVNISYIKALHRLENNEYEAELINANRLKVSRTFKAQVMQRLGV